MALVKLTLYPMGAPSTCTCEIEIDTEVGTVTEPDLASCAYTMESHKEALAGAKERAEEILRKAQNMNDETKKALSEIQAIFGSYERLKASYCDAISAMKKALEAVEDHNYEDAVQMLTEAIAKKLLKETAKQKRCLTYWD